MQSILSQLFGSDAEPGHGSGGVGAHKRDLEAEFDLLTRDLDNSFDLYERDLDSRFDLDERDLDGDLGLYEKVFEAEWVDAY